MGDEFGEGMLTEDADLAPAPVAPVDSLAASSFGAPAAGYGAVPSMIGDFFGMGYNYAAFNGATATPAGGDRILKRGENYNPFPVDRVFFNYNHFHNALVNTQGGDENLNRYTFGVEKTFFSGQWSAELRVPFAGTIDAVQDAASADADATEFGNLSLAIKALLIRRQCFALAGGLGIVFPTGDDSAVVDSTRNNGGPAITEIIFENESLHLQPFIGMYHAPTSNLFHQFLVQADFDASGSDVIVPPGSILSLGGSFSTLNEVSTLNSQALLFLDYSVGYWLFRNRCTGYVSGLAPMIELHYTTTMEDLDLGSFAGRGIFVEDLRRDVLNLTAGMFFEIGSLSSLKVATVVPLKDDRDRVFDAEFGLQYVRRF